MSASSKGHPVTAETRRKISAGLTGKHHSDATKEKLRRANLGKKQAPELVRKRTAHMKGEGHWNWKGGPAIRECEECGAAFTTSQALVRKGFGRFCSNRCVAIWGLKNGVFGHRPSKPEKKLMEMIEQHGLPFKYTGQGDFWIENRNPDFVNVNGKKQIIEIFSEYHHPINHVAERTYLYSKYGYSTLIIWSLEFKNPEKVLARVKSFARRHPKSTYSL